MIMSVHQELDKAWAKHRGSSISAIHEASAKGDRDFAVRFSDPSPRAFEHSVEASRRALERLSAISPEDLDDHETVDFEVLRWTHKRQVARAPYAHLRFPYTPYEWTLFGPDPIAKAYVFKNDEDVPAYLDLIASYPNVVSGLHQTLDLQLKEGVLLNRTVARNVRSVFSKEKRRVEQSALWPSEGRLNALSEAGRKQLLGALPALIENANLALNEFSKRIDDDYLQTAPRANGIGQYPGGREYYRVLVREFVDDGATPEGVFAQAWQVLHEIESELSSLRSRLGHHGSREAFESQLLRDKRFIARSPDEVRECLEEYQSRIDALMPTLFLEPVEFPYDIQRASPEVEAALTFGYYKTPTLSDPVGSYFFNGSDLEERSLLPSQALIYHELEPGHHRQLSEQAVSTHLHPWRRHFWHSNFGEAWAEYAQQLAYESGVFQSLEELYARRAFNAMFAARTIADIGVNYLGHSFDWGLSVLNRYTLESDHQNRSSLLRDTSDWHAQILPYCIGPRNLVRIREHARFKLGDLFDLKRFHRELLRHGTPPICVMEQIIRRFIESERKANAV